MVLDLILCALALCAYYSTGTLVAQSLPDRTGKQCRERWHNHLGSGIKKGDWSEEVGDHFVRSIDTLLMFWPVYGDIRRRIE
jgi:hypothetical protein